MIKSRNNIVNSNIMHGLKTRVSRYGNLYDFRIGITGNYPTRLKTEYKYAIENGKQVKVLRLYKTTSRKDVIEVKKMLIEYAWNKHDDSCCNTNKYPGGIKKGAAPYYLYICAYY